MSLLYPLTGKIIITGTLSSSPDKTEIVDTLVSAYSFPDWENIIRRVFLFEVNVPDDDVVVYYIPGPTAVYYHATELSPGNPYYVTYDLTSHEVEFVNGELPTGTLTVNIGD